MKLCFIVRTLRMGGFTSGLLPMLALLANDGVDVSLLYFEKIDEFTVDSRVRLIKNTTLKREMKLLEKVYLFTKTPQFITLFLKSILHPQNNEIKNAFRILFAQISQANQVNAYLEKCDLTQYDCVVAWEEMFASYFLANKCLAQKKIGCIHPDYRKAGFFTQIDEPFYRNLNKIAFVSPATKLSFSAAIPALAYKSVVIPNILPVDIIQKMSHAVITDFHKSHFDIVTVCRLDDSSKALLRALRIAYKAKTEGYLFRWYIIGEGHSRLAIENAIEQLDMKNTFILLGERMNPHPYTKQADLFVLQSYYEGKPISVAEAMIVGTPVLVTDYASAHEQVEDGVTGFITHNDENSIYAAFIYIMKNPNVLARMRKELTMQDMEKYTDLSLFYNAISDTNENGSIKA